MIVKQLVDQIISYSHDENTPDTNLEEKALSWLNAAYHELLQENLSFLKNSMLSYQNVPLQGDSFPVPEDFYLLEKIIPNNGSIIDKDNHDLYDIELNKLYLLKNKTANSVEFCYIPKFETLTIDGTVDNLIPSNYLSALLWGALVWSSIYERGLHTNAELALFDSKWESAKQKIKMTLASYSYKKLRVKPDGFFH